MICWRLESLENKCFIIALYFAVALIHKDRHAEGPVQVKNRIEWILTNINFTLSIGSLWRFPVLAYRESGGAFVVAYIVVFLCVGYPLALLEVALGQCTRRRAATVFKLCTALEGLSICMGLYSFVIPIYYNVIFAYSIYYIYHTFASELMWTKCQNWYNMPGYDCVDGRGVTETANVSLVSAEELFWHFVVLGAPSGIGTEPPGLNGSLAICLAISWSLIGLLLIHRIRRYAFAVEYLLIPLIFIILVMIVVLSVCLTGKERKDIMTTGIREFFVPSLEIFKNIQIWKEATQQVFFSLGVASGPLITLGSLSHFKSPVHIDSAIVCVINFAFALTSGIILFYSGSVISHEIGRNTAVVQSVNLFGCGIFFIAFSKVLGDLPLPQIWSVVFFLLVICMGSRAVMVSIDTAISVLRYFTPFVKPRSFNGYYAGVVIVICSFLLGLAAIVKGDTLVFTVLDRYGGATALPLVAAVECIGVSWIYGVVRFSGDIEFMLDFKPHIVLKILWLTIPAYLIIVISASWIHSWVVCTIDCILPLPCLIVGWVLVGVLLLPLPIRFIKNFIDLYKKKRLKEIFKSRDDAGPDDLELWFRNDNFFDAMSVRMQT